jgi:uncharacterized membrane protein
VVDGMARSQTKFAVDLVPLGLLAFLGIFWSSYTVADPDLWGHVRFGLDILRTGSIVQVDTYSYRTAGQTWINHEWLSEVIFAILYNLWGPAGLIALKVSVSALILGLGVAHLRRCGLGPFSTVILLGLIAFPFRMGLGTIRPQIFTYMLFFLELLVLERAEKGRRYWLWALPILFMAWVNLHGGVLAGIGVLGLWIVVQFINRLRVGTGPSAETLGEFVHIAIVGVACGLALLINPYRAALLKFLWRTATVSRPEITEWSPLGLTSLPGQVYLVILGIGICGLIYTTRRRNPEAIVIFCVTAVLPILSQRHYPLFALALLVLTGEHIADAWKRIPVLETHWSRQMRSISAIGFLLSGVMAVYSLPQLGCIRVQPYYFAFPARAVAFLRESGIRGNMAVPFDWGEYVLWHLGPGVKVSIDGRRETVYSDESYRESRDFERGTGVWDALLKSATTDLVLVPIGSPTANLLTGKNGWVSLYHDSFCVLFAREGHPSIIQLVRNPVPTLPDNGNGLCFPAPSGTHASAERTSRFSFDRVNPLSGARQLDRR